MNKQTSTTTLRPADRKLAELRQGFQRRPDVQAAVRRCPESSRNAILGAFAKAIRERPDLWACDHNSILDSLIEAMDLGLQPERGGEAYFIPRGKTCCFQVGYLGWVKLVLSSGQVTGFEYSAVRQGDKFVVREGYDPSVIHEWSPSPDRGSAPILYVYAIATFADGRRKHEIWSAEQINQHRDYYSKASTHADSAWKTAWLQMAYKTVIRSLCKMLPKSTAIERAIALETSGDEAAMPSDDPFSSAALSAAAPLLGDFAAAQETARDEPPSAEESEPEARLSDAALARLNELGAELTPAQSILQCQELQKKYLSLAEDAHEKTAVMAQVDWKCGQIREARGKKEKANA